MVVERGVRRLTRTIVSKVQNGYVVNYFFRLPFSQIDRNAEVGILRDVRNSNF